MSAQFLHLPPDGMPAVQGTMAGSLSRGGTLLIAHLSDTDIGRPRLPELFFTAEQLSAGFDPPDRDGPDRRLIAIRDAVMMAVRLT